MVFCILIDQLCCHVIILRFKFVLPVCRPPNPNHGSRILRYDLAKAEKYWWKNVIICPRIWFSESTKQFQQWVHWSEKKMTLSVIYYSILLKPLRLTKSVIQYIYLMFNMRYIELMKCTGNLAVRWKWSQNI